MPIRKGNLGSRLAVTAIALTVSGLFVVYRIRLSIETDVAATLALCLVVLLTTAFSYLRIKQLFDSTLELTDEGLRVRKLSRISTWHWSDVAAFAITDTHYMFAVPGEILELSRRVFSNNEEIVSRIRSSVSPEARGATSARAGLRRRILQHGVGALAVLPLVIGCMPLYLDFARRALIDCGVSTSRARLTSVALGLMFPLMALLVKLWFESVALGLVALGSISCSAIVAGLHSPLYVGPSDWWHMALGFPILVLIWGGLLRWKYRRDGFYKITGASMG